MKVEFLLAYDDNTWATETLDVPVSFEDFYREDDKVFQPFIRETLGYTKYRKVVLMAVYSIPEQEAT